MCENRQQSDPNDAPIHWDFGVFGSSKNDSLNIHKARLSLAKLYSGAENQDCEYWFLWDCSGPYMHDKDRGLGQNTKSQDEGLHTSGGCNHKQQADTESENVMDTY